MATDVYLRPLKLELKELWNNCVKTRDMQGLRSILHHALSFFGQLMTSQRILCCLVRAVKESLHVHTATNILTNCG
jgi:hypothetical protein